MSDKEKKEKGRPFLSLSVKESVLLLDPLGNDLLQLTDYEVYGRLLPETIDFLNQKRQLYIRLARAIRTVNQLTIEQKLSMGLVDLLTETELERITAATQPGKLQLNNRNYALYAEYFLAQKRAEYESPR